MCLFSFFHLCIPDSPEMIPSRPNSLANSQISARLHGNVALISMKDGWKSSTFCLKTTEVYLQAKIWCQLSSLKQIWESYHKATSVTSKLKSSHCSFQKSASPYPDDKNRVRNGFITSRNHKERRQRFLVAWLAGKCCSFSGGIFCIPAAHSALTIRHIRVNHGVVWSNLQG